ncbi:PepSY-associated TM helix domain-containing protein [Burkholderia glumae]|uniref:PepSY-associated TM helix domain-containing protein n=2 Tax=Burkholderia glumae TaxID=337 RepID=A0AAQ0BT80_BURGL|nr:PepSY-associated TM helix domain-containing protein [Burkholderia glumae]ACR30407.1 pepSY-associated TM helix family protein [Burkholderia glumae BGR1]AJY65214.1 pepSY-associated TM helix family protein [Burkholderia glumae LMG 2196 = ATCC 33617]MCM2481941.1 PepSY-associated TM helix domain-containing protein [Burkholderia glumae]MCM2507916.1 PepSY-associated TM helix domain-containing protein [Burkholderia glumae]MCM2536483.1 PepSY-associated TM helix domain-containing protein [Burkholderi
MNAPESIEPTLPAGIATRYASVARALDDTQRAAGRQRSRRATFVKWLRKVHGWVGLWGAVLGLMFGVTGFVLNHRAGPLRISPGLPQVSEVQLALPGAPPATPAKLEAWLRQQLRFDHGSSRIRREAAQAVAWGDRSIVQPEHWQITLFRPGANVTAEYWVGSRSVALKRTDNALMTTLTNLHRGVGMSVVWVLVMDTIAGAMILLSLTGVLLWTELNRRRTIGAVLVGASIAAALIAGLSS